MKLFDDNYSTFTFIYRCNGKDITVNMNKQDATVPQVLEEFMNFLKACGYCFDIDDYLDVVNDFKHDQAFDTMISDEEAEAKAYRDASDLKYPETEETIKWINASDGKEYTSYMFNDLSSTPNTQSYKPEDY